MCLLERYGALLLMDVMQQAEEVLEAAASEDSLSPYSGPLPPDRIAWIVMLAAFALFCTVTLSTVFGVYHYLFQSAVAMPVSLQVGTGTIGIVPGADPTVVAVREDRELTNTITGISTDSLSQATILIRDSAENAEADSLLAAITLQGDTQVTFNRASHPRFDWSQNPQYVLFSAMKGELDVLVSGVGDRAFVMDIYADDLSSDKGLNVEISSNGRYRLSVTEDEARVLNLAGKASAYFRDEQSRGAVVASGQELVVRIGARSFSLRSATESVLRNGSFSLLEGSRAAGALTDWRCSVRQRQAPPGDFSLVRFDGRVGLRLSRFNNAQSNGEARCAQTFPGEGLSVSEYDSLRVLTTFRTNYQSLSVCGREASECPLMLQISYFNQGGRSLRHWFRGFYYEDDVSADARKRCDTCIEDHVDINQGVWYTFDSDNLFNLIAESERPERIKSVSFYASGHQFDTIVSEMILLLGESPGG